MLKDVSLTLDEIDNLLAGKRGTKNLIDTSDRTYITWFKLTRRFKQELPAPINNLGSAKCSNPNCLSTNQTTGAIASVDDTDMCRLCFLAGYSLPTPQNNLSTETLTFPIND